MNTDSTGRTIYLKSEQNTGKYEKQKEPSPPWRGFRCLYLGEHGNMDRQSVSSGLIKCTSLGDSIVFSWEVCGVYMSCV